jgi:hypothetical protein
MIQPMTREDHMRINIRGQRERLRSLRLAQIMYDEGWARPWKRARRMAEDAIRRQDRQAAKFGGYGR